MANRYGHGEKPVNSLVPFMFEGTTFFTDK